VLLLSTSAFATESNEVNARVKTAFQKDFSKATAVNWEAKENFFFAEFKVNNVEFSAAYNEDGQLVATSRPVKMEQLPMAVTLSLNEKYAGYTFANNITEVTFERQTNYYLSVANDKQILRLKVSVNGDINVESKTKR
jgi:hypothetical protein